MHKSEAKHEMTRYAMGQKFPLVAQRINKIVQNIDENDLPRVVHVEASTEEHSDLIKYCDLMGYTVISSEYKFIDDKRKIKEFVIQV